MSWGDPFRDAWQRANPGAQAAARQAALGPEQAASALSDTIAHLYQRAQFAAQDMERLQGTVSPPPSSVQGTSALRRAMEEVRQGRIPAEKAEKHLQQAVRAAVREAKPAAPPVQAESNAEALLLAEQRFDTLRRNVLAQCGELRQRIAAQAAAGPPDDKRTLPLLQLTEACARIAASFLDHKRVDDPVAPAPPERQQAAQ